MFISGKCVVGLDVGSNSVKAVELTRNGHGVQVTGFGQVDLASDEPEARAEAVRQLLKDGGFKTKKVVTGVSGKSVVVRYLEMMPMDDDELRHAIRFEAEKFVPTDLESCVLDCQRLGNGEQTQGEVPVVLVAVEKTLVNEHMRVLQDAGITPEIVDLDGFAISNAWELFTQQGGGLAEDDGNAVAVIDVGAFKTTATVYHDGAARFTREIQIGGQDFTEAVSRSLGIDMSQAEVLKRCPGEDSDAVQNAVFPTIDDLGNELQLSFDYFEGQNGLTIGRVLVCGGGARLGFFREAIENICEKPTAVFNPFEGIPVSEDLDHELLANGGSQLAVAVGLAARLGGK